MTGYAQARKQSDAWSLRVSIKSVNHRFLDLKLQIPEGFDPYETRIRQLVRDHILRGHLYVVVNFEAQSAAGVQVNLPLVEAYLKAAEELRQKTKAATGMDVVGLLRLPGSNQRHWSGGSRERRRARKFMADIARLPARSAHKPAGDATRRGRSLG